jgi:hypothetical protein
VPPDEQVAGVPGLLSAIVMKLLAKKMSDLRFPDPHLPHPQDLTIG